MRTVRRAWRGHAATSGALPTKAYVNSLGGLASACCHSSRSLSGEWVNVPDHPRPAADADWLERSTRTRAIAFQSLEVSGLTAWPNRPSQRRARPPCRRSTPTSWCATSQGRGADDPVQPLLGSRADFESERALEVALQPFREGSADFADCLHVALATQADEPQLWTFGRGAAKVSGAQLRAKPQARVCHRLNRT